MDGGKNITPRLPSNLKRRQWRFHFSDFPLPFIVWSNQHNNFQYNTAAIES